MAPLKTILAFPPYAACRYGCAGCCAAPIAVFWLAAIVSLVYGLLGGPTQTEGVNWGTMALGVGLWGISFTWAMLTIRGTDADKCTRPTSTLCRKILPAADESDPLEEVRKAH